MDIKDKNEPKTTNIIKDQQQITKKENDDEIDIRNIYMTKRDHKHTRIGKEFQAIIPELQPKQNFTNFVSTNNKQKDKNLFQLTQEHKARFIYEREQDNSKPIKKIKY